jgi:hypothetical protein
MELVVDLSTKEVTVRDDDDLERFAVRAIPREGTGAGGPELAALAEVLETAAVGTVDRGEALIPPPAIRRLVLESASERGTSHGDEWESGFASMLDYAASKGWMSVDGAVRAHIEWGS